jgi:hypothetical protein
MDIDIVRSILTPGERPEHRNTYHSDGAKFVLLPFQGRNDLLALHAPILSEIEPAKK